MLAHLSRTPETMNGARGRKYDGDDVIGDLQADDARR